MNRLSPRQRQVVAGIVAGMTSKRIARDLGGISPRTVDKHREEAMRTLGVHDVASLVRLVSGVRSSGSDGPY
ncbi:LuxR C-terminal-related transcriptional regulator [Arhodomonas sp. AD133]|uniref:LuxR C-terminal-related transcriptional regulator n=1 Tax=Arhodomonas sp. AD133 TaxID=3415009 RepID=UPI003EBD9875